MTTETIMHHRFIVCIVAGAYCLQLTAQQPVRLPQAGPAFGHTLAEHDLQGKVRSMEIFYAELPDTASIAQAQFIQNSSIAFLPSGLVSKLDYYYNDPGQPAQRVPYEFAYDPSGSRLLSQKENGVERTMVKYDKEGRIAEVLYRSQEKEGNVRMTYEYDAQGRCTSEQHYNHKNKLTFRGEYEYDAGRRIERIVSFHCSATKKCDPVSDALFEYDARGNLVKEQFSGLMNYSALYEYDAVNRLVRAQKRYEDEPISEVENFVYRYDDQGRLVAEFSSGNFYNTETYYSHDSQGNWTEMRSLTESEQNTSVLLTKRTILYFE